MARAREKLKAWRNSKGWTQTKAAEEVGVTQASWSAWEAGSKRPSIEQLVQLADLTRGSQYRVTVADWVESEDDRAERQAIRRARKRRPRRRRASIAPAA